MAWPPVGLQSSSKAFSLSVGTAPSSASEAAHSETPLSSIVLSIEPSAAPDCARSILWWWLRTSAAALLSTSNPRQINPRAKTRQKPARAPERRGVSTGLQHQVAGMGQVAAAVGLGLSLGLVGYGFFRLKRIYRPIDGVPLAPGANPLLGHVK